VVGRGAGARGAGDPAAAHGAGDPRTHLPPGLHDRARGDGCGGTRRGPRRRADQRDPAGRHGERRDHGGRGHALHGDAAALGGRHRRPAGPGRPVNPGGAGAGGDEDPPGAGRAGPGPARRRDGGGRGRAGGPGPARPGTLAASVDEILGKQEVVGKDLGEFLHFVCGVPGAGSPHGPGGGSAGEWPGVPVAAGSRSGPSEQPLLARGARAAGPGRPGRKSWCASC
jgi:hypothetical protein